MNDQTTAPAADQADATAKVNPPTVGALYDRVTLLKFPDHIMLIPAIIPGTRPGKPELMLRVVNSNTLVTRKIETCVCDYCRGDRDWSEWIEEVIKLAMATDDAEPSPDEDPAKLLGDLILNMFRR